MSDMMNPSTSRFSLLHGGIQTDEELARELERRRQPWTIEDYERVRQAAIDLSRSHVSVDRMGKTLSCFDGRAYWALLGALDRTES